MNLRIFENLEDLSHAAARSIRQSGAKKIGVTGGSTPKRLYEILAESLPEDVTWVLVDERYVPHDDPQSNAAMIERTLFRHGLPERWLKFDTSLNDPALTARRFEEAWDFGDLDLVLLGCGEDGHTASLFPGTPVLDVVDRIASEVYVPHLEQWRVTITLPVIRAAKLRMVLASGPSKMPVIEAVREGADYPVTRATVGVETWWLVSKT
ncbi:MAG TPA: 6-phosphogluconolactonase [Thermoanaerobaculia bacterium]|jgi:6-phosphogluconolactonase|nr:6-phosphogluconolactonase [Thermoanaerobaculia bacterium]